MPLKHAAAMELAPALRRVNILGPDNGLKIVPGLLAGTDMALLMFIGALSDSSRAAREEYGSSRLAVSAPHAFLEFDNPVLISSGLDPVEDSGREDFVVFWQPPLIDIRGPLDFKGQKGNQRQPRMCGIQIALEPTTGEDLPVITCGEMCQHIIVERPWP